MLGLKVKVTSLPTTGKKAARVFINIGESVHPVAKTVAAGRHDIPLAHIASNRRLEAERLVEQDYSLTHGAGLRTGGSTGIHLNIPDPRVHVSNGNLVSHPCRSLLVTGIFNSLDQPLFWRHDLDLIDDTQPVQVMDQNEQRVDPRLYKLVTEVDPEDSGHVNQRTVLAHNLEPDAESGTFYFVRAKNANGELKTKLLSRSPLFIKAPSLTIPKDYSLSLTGSLLVYWVSDEPQGYRITLPEDYFRTAWKLAPESFLRAFMSPGLLSHEPWLPLIPDGAWRLENGQTLSVPEWKDQPFYPYGPTRLVKGDACKVVAEGLVQVSQPGVMPSLSFQATTRWVELLLFKEEEDEPSLALTNDLSRDGAQVPGRGTLTWTHSNFSLSPSDGLVHSPLITSDYSIAQASYPCSVTHLELTTLDLNPFRNPSLLGKTVVYYLVPGATIRGVEALTYDEEGLITWVSQDAGSPNGDMSSWVGKLFRRELSPARVPESTIGLRVSLGESFYNKLVLQDYGYLILGRYHFPETLDESRHRIVTELELGAQASPIALAKTDPLAYALLNDFGNGSRVPLPSLITGQQLKVHWTLFQDWVPGALFTKDLLSDRLATIFPAGVSYFVSSEGVPVLHLQKDSINIPSGTASLVWFPVPYSPDGKVIGGKLYQGATEEVMTTLVATIPDLSKVSTHSVSLPVAGQTSHFQIEPFVTISGTVHSGPKSNIIRLRR